MTVPCGNPFGDNVSELVFDVDYMMGALPDGRYRHAPATWTFHGITDLNMTFSSSDSGFQDAPSGFLIEDFTRELVRDQKVCLDRLYYSWALDLTAPPSQSARITWGSYGFTFEVGQPILDKPQQ